MHYCKAIPTRIWRYVKTRFILELDVPDREEAYQWINHWLAEQPYSLNRARLLTVVTGKTRRRDPDEESAKFILCPAPGNHWFFYKNRLVRLFRERKDDAGEGKITMGIRENFTIQMFSRNRELVKELLLEARESFHPSKKSHTKVYVNSHYDWDLAAKKRKRPIDSIILPNGLMEELIGRVQRFKDQESWYHDCGIPYRLGILLEGPPGSGKSSVVSGLASHFDMDVATLNLASGFMEDANLQSLLTNLPHNSILLIEDIDCVFHAREKKEKSGAGVTFSGLLNAIDGISAGEKRILVMTTNHPEKLDPALIRPGRADIRYRIDHPSHEQVSRLYERFYGSSGNEFASAIKHFDRTSMAALQGHFTRYKDRPKKALKRVNEVYHEFDCVFADPPDGIGLAYDEFNDKISEADYRVLLARWLERFCELAPTVWISFNARWTAIFGGIVDEFLTLNPDWDFKPFVQVFTFGQNCKTDSGNGHRPLWRFMHKHAPLYPDAIKVPSWRELNGDPRAAKGGRVPLDFWDFPRVTGNSKQRRKWHKTQLNEGLVERALKMTTKEGDRVLDPFGGTGTTMRVCKRIKRQCTLIEISSGYCDHIAEEHGLK
ncbi:Probable mitochondrial chaperone bcs1 (BCS1-like protein), partial [Durusdinium trenchii]